MEKASRPQNHEKTLEQLREQTDDKEEKQREHNLRPRGIGGQLRAAAKLGYPNSEDAEDPMIRKSPGAPKQRPLVTTKGFVPALSHPQDHS